MPLNIEGAGKISGLTDPAAAGDAARKAFVEAKVAEVEISGGLGDLNDVDTIGVAAGDVLTYFDGEDAGWAPSPLDPPPSALDDLSDVDTTGAVDGEALVFSSGSWAPAEVGGGLSGTSYVFVAGDGTAAENGTALDDAYTTAKGMTPYGNALSTTNRVSVVVAPGIYDTTLAMDGAFVNVVSLDGGMSIRLTGINITADNVLVRGIDVGTTNFLIATNLGGLVAENCKGGDNSFGYTRTASGTFTNCTGGVRAFGYYGTASGTFTNCTGGDRAFGYFGTASGTFTNCTGGMESFGGDGTASGTFTNCTGGVYAFGGFSTASGTFTNCTGGDAAFAGYATASGTFTNCTGGDVAFGGFSTASGTFTNCTGGQGAFGGGGTLSGLVLRCRVTGGDFKAPSSGGKVRLSLTSTFAEVNTG